MRFLVDRKSLGHVSVRASRLFPVRTIPPTLHIIFILILILSEGQAGEDWETLNNVMFCGISGRTGQQSTFQLPFHSCFKGL